MADRPWGHRGPMTGGSGSAGWLPITNTPTGHRQHAGDHPLHLGDAEPFAQIGPGSAHHQAAQEHGQQHEQHHAVDAGTDAAEHHFTQQHVDLGAHAGEGAEAVVHGVDREPLEAVVVAFRDAGQHGAEAASLPSRAAGFEW